MGVREHSDIFDTKMMCWNVSWDSPVLFNGKLKRSLAKAWERYGDQETRTFRDNGLSHPTRSATRQAKVLTKDTVNWVVEEGEDEYHL